MKVAKAEEDWLRDSIDALDLAPQVGEEEKLSTRRTMLTNISKIGERVVNSGGCSS